MIKDMRGKLKNLVIFVSVVVLLTPLSAIAIVGTSSAPNVVSVTYSFQTPTTSKISIASDVYDQVNLQDAAYTGNPNEPQLPVTGAYILLPQNTKIQTIQVTGEKQRLGTGYHIVPCGKSIPIGTDVVPQIPTPDQAIYSSNALFPGVLYSEVGTYFCKGYAIAVLMLRPIQYIPATGELFYYTAMTVTITVAADQQPNTLYRGFAVDQRDVMNLVDNPDVANTYQTVSGGSSLSDEFDLLIITTDALKSGFEPLAADHNAAGMRTTIKTLTDIGSSDPENIRQYIKTAYSTWGISYVLLGGDSDVVPARLLYVQGMDENTTFYDDNLPADHYYGCLDGTYNYNGNNKWGEPTDGDGGGDVDLMAEVYVGRACVGSPTEVNNFVEKTRTYLGAESESYLDITSFVGEYLGDYGIASFGDNYLDQLIDGSTADGYTTVGVPSSQYTIDKLYEQTYPGFDPNDPSGTGWPASELITRINNGVHIINHLGHSNYNYDLRLGSDDVDALSNTEYCFIYSQGCMAGGFDNPEGYDCIAEHFTVKTAHAAFAGIFNARYGFFWSFSTDGDSQRFHRHFWDEIYGNNVEEIGRANQKSKEDNLFIIGRSCIRWVYYETNLFGDPTLTFHAPSARPHLELQTVTGGFGSVSVDLLNNGSITADHVDWTINVRGGLMKRINATTTGTVLTLESDNTTTLKTGAFLFGLGKINITITAEYSDPKTTTGFILGPFILKIS